MAKSIKGSQPGYKEKIKKAGRKGKFEQAVKTQDSYDRGDSVPKGDDEYYKKYGKGRYKTKGDQESRKKATKKTTGKAAGPNRRESPDRLETPKTDDKFWSPKEVKSKKK